MSDTNELVERLTGFANGTFQYRAYRGKAPDGVPQLRSDILALVAALAPIEAVPVVKLLEWRPTASGYGVEAHTILGKYWVQDGQFWAPNCTVSHPYRTDEAAKAGAQEHFNAAVSSALALPPAQAGAVTEIAEIIYRAYGFDPAGKTEKADGTPYGEWAKAIEAATRLTAALGAQTPPEGAVMEALEPLLQSVGDSIAAVFDQMLKGNWKDDHDHDVLLNKAMVDLKAALGSIMAFRTKHLGYSTPPANQSEGAGE